MHRLLFVLLLAAPAFPAELPITGLAHVGFLTSDVSRAESFYSGVLGYPRVFDLRRENGEFLLADFKVNDEQYIEVFPGLAPSQDVRMNHFAMHTGDIEALHRRLTELGLKPSAIGRGRDTNRNFSITDPFGTRVEFVQFMPGSLQSELKGKQLGERRISTRLRHVGIPVTNLDSAMAFYAGKLGFRETWRGGPADGEVRWVNMRLPGPSGDYIEFMLYSGAPTRSQLGSMLHICLEVPDIQAAYKELLRRGVPAEERYKPRVGRNKRWLLNLFDPDGSRTELMEPKLVP